VLLAWQRTGAIFVQCRRKHRPIGPVPTSWTDQDRVDLASDTVVSAIMTFRAKALVGGRWTFEGGASLRTFIGACVQAYPSIYRRWRTKHLAEIGQCFLGAGGELDGIGRPVLQPIVDPEESIVRWSEITEGLNDLPDDRTRVAVVAMALGYTNVQIADLLTEITEGAVKQLLYRHRRRTQKGETS
jgi:DNA-directed RNA polymerase specialized sigma24 family protein